jgi:RND family efflux transporter MFP subunit
MSSLEIEVDVNESFINRVYAGQEVVATLDAYPDWKIPAKVIAVIPTADRQKATVRVRIGFEQLDPRMLPQMGVKVAFQAGPADTAAAQVVTVPTAALWTEEGHDFVWRFRNGHVERVRVRIGSRRSDEAIVNEGLSPGDQLVVDPAPNLREGSRVRVQRR